MWKDLEEHIRDHVNKAYASIKAPPQPGYVPPVQLGPGIKPPENRDGTQIRTWGNLWYNEMPGVHFGAPRSSSNSGGLSNPYLTQTSDRDDPGPPREQAVAPLQYEQFRPAHQPSQHQQLQGTLPRVSPAQRQGQQQPGDTLVCPTCGMIGFADQFELTDHSAVVHLNEGSGSFQGKPLRCPHSHCQELLAFASWDALLDHLAACHGRPYICEAKACRAGFSTREAKDQHRLSVHKRTPGARHEFCRVSECGLAFPNHRQFDEHRRSQHQNSPRALWPHYCEFPGCNVGFLLQKKLAKHIQDEHLKGRPTPSTALQSTETGPTLFGKFLAQPQAYSWSVSVAPPFSSYPQEQTSYTSPPVPSYGQLQTQAGIQSQRAENSDNFQYGGQSGSSIGELGMPSSARGQPPVPPAQDRGRYEAAKVLLSLSSQVRSRESSDSNRTRRQPPPKKSKPSAEKSRKRSGGT